MNTTDQRNQDRFSLLLFLFVVMTIVIVFLASNYDFSEKAATSLQVSYWVSFGNTRKTAVQLEQKTPDFIPFKDSDLAIGNLYGYLWVQIKNTSKQAFETVITNRNTNYYTEFLKPQPGGAVTMYRHGDIVPANQSPIRSLNSAFPVLLPENSINEFILEYHGPRGILVSPQVLSVSDFTDRTVLERSIIGGISGAILALLIISIFGGILLKQPLFFVIAAFDFSIYFFFLRQSRVLLIYFNSMIYPDWLFALSIFTNLCGALILGFGLFSKYLLRPLKITLISLGVLGSIFLLISFVTAPYQIADILNILSILSLVALGIPIYLVFKQRDYPSIWIVLTYIPWIIMMLLDIFSGLGGVREAAFLKYRQVFALIAHMFLFLAVILYLMRQRFEQQVIGIREEMDHLKEETSQEMLSLQGISQSMLFELHNQLRRPVESIIATARILCRHFTNPRITAATQVIIDEAIGLKQNIQKTAGCIDFDERLVDRSDCLPLVDSPEGEVIVPSSEDEFGTIWIYDTDDRKAMHLGLILQAEGYRVHTSSNNLTILQEASQAKIDTLIVDPTSMGEQAYILCRIIRDSHNLFELPILMITNYFADHLMQKGFAVGVNDFLTHPFEASELTVRIQTLVRLRQIASHNITLSESEREKNAFLFFLTHNVNTPLTILLNRVRDLQRFSESPEIEDILDDLRISSDEINDIVQNVLISFRLSDGRQTLRLEDVDLDNLLGTILREVQRKADAKEQTISLSIPKSLPLVYGDATSLKGIIYNLIDNAIKFTPPQGNIEVALISDKPVILKVSDTGPGISEKDISRLFGRFEKLSTRPTGGESSTGLGLFVARELARMNGGSLHYQAAEGGGAAFLLQLTAWEEAIHG